MQRIPGKEKNNKKLILLFYLFFCLFGLTCLLSASSPYESEKLTGDPNFLFFNQLIAFLISLGCLAVFSSFDYKLLRSASWILTLFVLICLLLVQFSPLGILAGGAKRWLNLGFFSFQPSEICKITVTVLLADALAKKRFNQYQLKDKLKNLAKISLFLLVLVVAYLVSKDLENSLNLLVLALSFFALYFIFVKLDLLHKRISLVLLIVSLILKQPDLGTGLLLVSTSFFLFFINGLNLAEIVTLCFALIGLLTVNLKINLYQYERIKAWLNPYDHPLSLGYNLIQSYYAIGRGGIWGVGYGSSEQKLGYLPVAYSDFIYSIICEELGLIGSILVVGSFITFLWKGFSLLLRVQEKFGKILGLGLIFCICFQTVFNLAGVTGLLPITGITLPFVSYGKSSLITLGIMIGIIINIIDKDSLIDSSKITKQK